MVNRTYISKMNTIISGEELNTGLNPISELTYGANSTRTLLYFDVSKLKEMYNENYFSDLSNVKHYLKITNAVSVDQKQLHFSGASSISGTTKKRASSFDLIFFLIPRNWDCGKGYDYNDDVTESNKIISKDGSNWFQSSNGYKWDEEGIYSINTLSREYDKFSSSEGSNVIIARQHFDIGNENINVDITETVNKFIKGELENYGIGIAFSPMLENTITEEDNFIGLITNKTQTFFEPYLETIYNDRISDDRSHFAIGKDNKLYLYCNIGGQFVNLDETPTCEVNGEQYVVKQFSKGIYYIDIFIEKGVFKPNTMLYDTWGNIIYQGVRYDDIELDFVLKSNSIFFNVGSLIETHNNLIPTVYGINESEKIKRGDIRKLVIRPMVEYGKNVAELVDNMQLRLYVKDGMGELDVISFDGVNKTFSENYYLIDTNMLIPNRYYVDIKFNYNLETIVHHNVLSFDIVNDCNKLRY
ncbi:MAG: hypothetical protein IKT40_02695 [Bacilli bacterium]|nr:hypothetical protein [Bacilli bacterium]